MKDTIATGFLEMLPAPGEPARDCVELLPPSLRQQFDAMEQATR